MKVILGDGKLVLVPQDDEEARELAGWKASHGGHVFHVQLTSGTGMGLFDLGPAPEACREPLPVSSQVKDETVRLIGNFAATPFSLDDREYASVESFWQGLKFASAAERRRVAQLSGPEAKRAGEEQGYGETVSYEGEKIPVGTWKHWALMERACWAKFTQNADAREALLATGERPLVHRMRRDSKTIPGVIMADIWMRLRRRLREEG